MQLSRPSVDRQSDLCSTSLHWCSQAVSSQNWPRPLTSSLGHLGCPHYPRSWCSRSTRIQTASHPVYSKSDLGLHYKLLPSSHHGRHSRYLAHPRPPGLHSFQFQAAPQPSIQLSIQPYPNLGPKPASVHVLPPLLPDQTHGHRYHLYIPITLV